MAAALTAITVRVKLAWWVLPWLHTLIFFCQLMEREPDYEKVMAVMRRGTRVSVEKA